MKGLITPGLLMLVLCVADGGKRNPFPSVSEALKSVVALDPPAVPDHLRPSPRQMQQQPASQPPAKRR